MPRHVFSEWDTGPRPANQQFLQIALKAMRKASPPFDAFALKMERAFLLSMPGVNQPAAYLGTSNFLSVVDLSVTNSVPGGTNTESPEGAARVVFSFWTR